MLATNALKNIEELAETRSLPEFVAILRPAKRITLETSSVSDGGHKLACKQVVSYIRLFGFLEK